MRKFSDLAATVTMVLLTGCQTSMIVDTAEYKPIPDQVVKFNVSEVTASDLYTNYGIACGVDMSHRSDASFNQKLISGLNESDRFKAISSDDGLDVKLDVKETFYSENTAEESGFFRSINNLVSVCTLTLWPFIEKGRYNYEVTVDSVLGKRKYTIDLITRDWFSLGPIALIPVPGIAEARTSGDMKKDIRMKVFGDRLSERLVELGGEVSIDSDDEKVRRAALGMIADQDELAMLVRKSPFEDVRAGAAERIVDPGRLTALSRDKAVDKKLREKMIDKLMATDRLEYCTELFCGTDEPWIELKVFEKIDSGRLADEAVRSRLLKMWRTKQIPLEVRSRIYLRLAGADLSSADDQSELAKAVSISENWKSVFDKIVKSGDLNDPSVLLDLALGKYECDNMVAEWAVAKLDDSGLLKVLRTGDVESCRNAAVGLFKGDAVILEAVLDKTIKRDLRDKIFNRIAERKTSAAMYKAVFLGTDEFWLCEKTFGGFDANVRSEKDVSGKAMSWFRDQVVGKDDRAWLYLLIERGDFSEGHDQELLAELLEGAAKRNEVFAKMKKTGDLVSMEQFARLADGGYDVDETVALWAVEKLDDKNLLIVAKKAKAAKVAFKAVCNLKDGKSIETVAQGEYSTVARIEAINRLGKESEAALKKIAVCNDENFRRVALDRMTKLGLSLEATKRESEAVARKERAAKEEAKRKEQEERTKKIAAAKHDIRLAKIDESIGTYVAAVGASPKSGAEFSFKGTVETVTSRNWKPKVRIFVKGANKTLRVLCHVRSKLDAGIKEGAQVEVSGKLKSGDASEAVLTDSVIALDKEAE